LFFGPSLIVCLFIFILLFFLFSVWFLYISSICSYADNFLYLVVKNIPEKKGLEGIVDIITNIVVHVIAIHWKKRACLFNCCFRSHLACWVLLLTHYSDQLWASATSAGHCSTYLDFTLPSQARPSLRNVGRGAYLNLTHLSQDTPWQRKLLFWGAVLPCNVAQLLWCETYL